MERNLNVRWSVEAIFSTAETIFQNLISLNQKRESTIVYLVDIFSDIFFRFCFPVASWFENIDFACDGFDRARYTSWSGRQGKPKRPLDIAEIVDDRLEKSVA